VKIAVWSKKRSGRTVPCFSSKEEGGLAMLKKMSAWVLFFGIVTPLSAAADDSFVKFKGGIGVIPVSSGVAVAPTLGTAQTVESVNRNIVRGVQPPGQIWVISDLRADVKADGSIKVTGKGLLLGGGNGIGGNAGQSVRATLICEAVAPFVLHDTDPVVPLEANGDFRIDDVLSPTLPAVCDSPVLLIRNPAGAWFAAGIPDRGNDD
jgi:hypothetical protein